MVRISLLFAICLEVMPVEADVVSVLCSLRSLFLVCIVKVTCLALILLPLIVYIWLNGVRALKYAWGRVTVVLAIVAVSLAFDYFVIWGR